MTRTTRSVLLVPLVAAALFGAGCSTVVEGTAAPAGAGQADPAAPPAAGTDDPVVWVDSVCGALLPFIQTASVQPELNTSGSPDELVQGLSDYLGQASAAAGSAIEGMRAAGPSPVEQGDELVTGLTEALTTFQTTFDSTKTRLDAVDTSDPAALATALPEAIAPLQDLANVPDPTDQLQSNSELDAAAEQAPNCQQIETVTGG